jgi:hypothetical protein
MNWFLHFCVWMQHVGWGVAIRESEWLFPIIETLHVFGIIALVGSTSILDLRLMGLTFRDEPVSKLASRFLPWSWFGFITQVVTGILMFGSEPIKMYGNWAFWVKMVLIVVAGLNATIFHFLAYQSVDKWDKDPVAPVSARIAGTVSILLWFGIVGLGRWIAYVV